MAPQPQDLCPPGDREAVGALLRSGQARIESWAGIDYIRIADEAHGFPRGTVYVEGRRIPAFPPIAHIFALRRGLARAFPGPFHAEEKIDGYNVRIARVSGRTLCFTRGGFLCPFTMDRLGDLVDPTSLFERRPGCVLCGEVAGPDNPYLESTTPRVREDVAFFAFDLIDLGTEAFVPVDERVRLLREHGIPAVPAYGWFDAGRSAELRDLVLRLDREGAEGLVFKPAAEGLRLKYVTPRINADDIAVDGPLLAELPPEFFLGRLLRMAIAIEELGLSPAEVAELEGEVGRALVSRFLPVVRAVARGGKAARTYRVRLRSAEAADALVRHLNRASSKVQARELARHREGNWIVLTFEKTFLRSTSTLRNLLDGHHVVD